MVHRKVWISFLLCTTILAAFSLRANSQGDAGTVSLIQLIANPEKYDGKHLGVIGFFRLEFEGNMLYFHKDDYTYHIRENAVRVGLTKTQNKEYADKNMHYAFVVGTFRAGKEGTSNADGTIVNITTVEPWPVVGPAN